jgi:hypothetical protein
MNAFRHFEKLSIQRGPGQYNTENLGQTTVLRMGFESTILRAQDYAHLTLHGHCVVCRLLNCAFTSSQYIHRDERLVSE